MRSSTPAHRWTSRPLIQTDYRQDLLGGRRAVVRLGWASAAARAAVARRSTPLHWAAYNGNADATAALLGSGADGSIKDNNEYAAPRRAARPTATSRSRGARRNTAEQAAPWNAKSGAYAAAVEQARGRSARHRLPHAGKRAAPISYCTVGRALWHARVHV
jgi:hypothetical protein